MDDLTAKRTLVKSPPELWTELSEVEGLARHLGDLGEIRITKVEPERTVAWEGEHASGTVEIEASGWGTKVTLTAAVAEPELPESQPVAEPPADADPVAEPDAEPAPGGKPEVAIAQDEHATEPEPADKAAARLPEAEAPAVPWLHDPAPPPPVSEPRPEPGAPRWEPPRTAPTPEPGRRGILARLLGRRSRPKPAGARAPRPASVPRQPPRAWQEPAWHTRTEPTPEPDRPTPAPMTEQKATPVGPGSDPGATTEPGPASVPGLAPEPQTEPALDHGKVLAVLEGALDSLGSAHHRPFSRD